MGLELWLAGLLVGLLAGSGPVLAALRGPRRRWSFAAGVTVIAVVIAAVVSGAAVWAARGAGSSLTVGRATLPAVAVEQGSGPLANRLLLLRPSPEVVDFVLAGQEPGELLRDLDRQPDADDDPLVAAVAELVGGRGADSLDASSLARLGIGFVQVSDRSDSSLDPAARLSRGAQPPRLQCAGHPLEGATAAGGHRRRCCDGAVAGSSRRRRGRPGRCRAHERPARRHRHRAAGWRRRSSPRRRRAGPVGRAGRRDDRRSATSPVAGADQPTYAVPAAGGDLRVDLAAADPWWRVGQAALLAFVVFMAVPFGNRRSRRRS